MMSLNSEGVSSGWRSPVVLLLATDTPLPYRVLRCAAHAGAKVIVLGGRRAKLLALSRYCREFILCPVDFVDESIPVILDEINRITSERVIDQVIPGDGTTTGILARIKDHVHVRCFPLPSAVAFGRLNDKGKFADLCRELNLPHPKSMLAKNVGGIGGAVENMGLPLIAKPVDNHGGVGVSKVDRWPDSSVTQAIDYSPVLLQEYIDGEDICVSLFCEKGACRQWVAYQRKNGEYRFCRHGRLMDLAQTVARYLQVDGVICFDARLAPGSGMLYLIECNPRFWYNVDYAMLAGANFVALGLPECSLSDDVVTDGFTVSLPHTFLAKMMMPWTITKADLKALRFWLSDPWVFFVIETWLNPRFDFLGRVCLVWRGVMARFRFFQALAPR
ncbi:ATP-grasp domain-containing protein [Methylococcus sp. ANG]|uniref:ATP-grasp domain-containing protein n=1 Tax=Methylococcus sp. ANG TaxID=3231903 RepID=UPI0034584470